ncbi:hypothetical protein MJT46_001311 [Ovis ammon polii x Ovis aries]|nr:hypothetical protein MJT46_001311 [Ovis ammon polii x Ovis aries]
MFFANLKLAKSELLLKFVKRLIILKARLSSLPNRPCVKQGKRSGVTKATGRSVSVFSLQFSACVLGPAHGARDALSSFGNFTIGVRFLGDSVNNWCSSVSFRFGMGDSTGDLNKAKTHCCVSFHCGTCSFTVDGHESPEWSWIWTEKKFLYKAL